jgi:hypothetical protein
MPNLRRSEPKRAVTPKRDVVNPPPAETWSPPMVKMSQLHAMRILEAMAAAVGFMENDAGAHRSATIRRRLQETADHLRAQIDWFAGVGER